MNLALYLRTIRHLRPRQVTARLLGQLRIARGEHPLRGGQRVPPYPGCRWHPLGAFLPPGRQENVAAEMLRGSLMFLNERRETGWPPRWSEINAPRLWRYHLHYFDYLWALDPAQARAVVADWIGRAHLGKDLTGWEPYPISLRLANWCAVLLGRDREQTESDHVFLAELWRSICLQARWLSRHCEYHLMANHLLENAAALALTGSCFDGAEARGWADQGCRILAREIPEQFLRDGMQFERSPMYHARAVGMLTALLNTGNFDLEPLVHGPLARAVTALAHLCHPDGDIALLNDSALGEAGAPSRLLIRASETLNEPRPNEAGLPGPFALPSAGYYGWRTDDGAYVVCDAGPVGPDCNPGHAHGDILSFELSLRGRRVVVDAGTYDYESGPLRAYCRSTKAHNTVEVGGRDQCEFWGVFRVGRRGRPHDVFWEPNADGFRLAGWHDGYDRLPGRPRHKRRFTWHAPGVLMVCDTVEARLETESVTRIHLHPDCRIESQDGSGVTVGYGPGWFHVRFAGPGELLVESLPYCPEFGVKADAPTLTFRAKGREVHTGFCVAPDAHDVALDLQRGAVVDGREYSW